MVITLLLFAAGPLWAEGSPSLQMRVAAGRLSMTAATVSLTRILSELQHVSGINLLLEPALESQLARQQSSLALKDVAIEDALRRLLPGRGLVFVYWSGGLAEVRIYATAKPEDSGLLSKTKSPVPVPPRPAVTAKVAPKRGNVVPGAGFFDGRPNRLPTEAEKAAAQATEMAAVQRALDAIQRVQDPDELEEALGALAGAAGVPVEPLLDLAVADQQPDLRSQALQLAAEHGPDDPRVIALLRSLAARDESDEVQDTARILLQEIGQ